MSAVIRTSVCGRPRGGSAADARDSRPRTQRAGIHPSERSAQGLVGFLHKAYAGGFLRRRYTVVFQVHSLAAGNLDVHLFRGTETRVMQRDESAVQVTRKFSSVPSGQTRVHARLVLFRTMGQDDKASHGHIASRPIATGQSERSELEISWPRESARGDKESPSVKTMAFLCHIAAPRSRHAAVMAVAAAARHLLRTVIGRDAREPCGSCSREELLVHT